MVRPLYLLLAVLCALELFTHGAHALDDPFAKWTDGSQDEEEDLDDTMPYRDHEVDHERVQIIEEHGTSVEELHDEEEQFSHSDTDNVPEHYEDDRRLTEEAVGTPEPDEYAGLEGIDLSSPFHIDFADKSTLVRLVDWAYDRTAFFSRFGDGYVHAEELARLFGFVLNPTDQTLDPESYLLLDAAADEMRAVQGLLDDALVVPRGFISRGMPLRSLQDLAKQMHEHHTQYRRLGARADEL